MVSAGGPLRIVFFGTPAFAVATLDALLQSRHTVAGVVTQPDRPRGRGQRTSDAPVKARAVEAGLSILQPERLNDASTHAALAGLGADLGVVAAYGKLLPEPILAMPRLGLINVHASLLPRYRGAAPVHRAIAAGEQETGITIMRVVKALDAGPMMARAQRPIGPDDTSEEVERDLAQIGGRLLVSTIEAIAAGTVSETPQDERDATYAPRLVKEDGRIDWAWPAARIHNLVRGLHPWPHAYTFLAGDRYILHRSRVLDDLQATAPGAVLEAAGDHLRIAAGTGALDVLEIQSEGKRPMAIREFLAGRRLSVGDCFAPRP